MQLFHDMEEMQGYILFRRKSKFGISDRTVSKHLDDFPQSGWIPPRLPQKEKR